MSRLRDMVIARKAIRRYQQHIMAGVRSNGRFGALQYDDIAYTLNEAETAYHKIQQIEAMEQDTRTVELTIKAPEPVKQQYMPHWLIRIAERLAKIERSLNGDS